MDVDAIHLFLSEQAYWAIGRPREIVAHVVETSYRVIGLFHDGRQIGFCRAISDGAIHAYLADVYILEPHRGKGLGEAMVREMVESGELAGVRWMLHTGDLQPLYAKLGFGPASARAMERTGGPVPG